ncbi:MULTISPECIES: hypothetical protein [Acetobacter]|jgi:hypothetical protein|uniref:Uncharacterized protein n=1 Tax=Acetobacter lovaniensis TaxID=104100 RepID=A0A841QH06_9PROT|nr:hypothetical protein [Acetobacter lovaniensis]MBB6457534.1 hypothetical protein [Acetobacter lovaniensis]MCP1240315.1 hypothetical protein [Acetobacter lovaniensis]NHN81828.1 hypothetical protein [Acetobacter lovaniensis]GBQ71110.1 hypothetical protein AA0474_2375 [Acetobacter lovaniensis NRIC 0474]
MKVNFRRMPRYVSVCLAMVSLAAAVSPAMADTQPDVSADSAKNGTENGHSMRPLWVLLAQRGPDNEDAMMTASFYTKAACEDALKFFREQQEHPNREFHGVCLPSGAA